METASTPTWPTAQPDDASFWQRRGVVIALRTVSVLLGLAGAAIALFFAGVVAVFSDCSDGATGMCTNYAGVVPVLEAVIVLVAFVAPLAGGIVACVRKEWPWLAAGLFVGAMMVMLMFALAEGQAGTLS